MTLSRSTNDLLNIEVEAAGTEFAANNASQSALSTLFDGDLWMTYRNVLSGINYWDFVSYIPFLTTLIELTLSIAGCFGTVHQLPCHRWPVRFLHFNVQFHFVKLFVGQLPVSA